MAAAFRPPTPTQVAKDDADDRFVFVISDANLAQYGVGPQQLASALQDRLNTTAEAASLGSCHRGASRSSI